MIVCINKMDVVQNTQTGQKGTVIEAMGFDYYRVLTKIGMAMWSRKNIKHIGKNINLLR